MLVPWTVPDFFQEESPEALRCQTDWLVREVGLDGSFFARLVRTDASTFASWRMHGGELPPAAEKTLRAFWQAMLHLLSFLNFDTARVRDLFEHTIPVPPAGTASPLTPPWGGST